MKGLTAQHGRNMATDNEDGDAWGALLGASEACKRKLVHWVNSLPLAACLLVEDLEELRHGDVLWAIVRWLEAGNSSEETDEDEREQRALVARAVRYAAQRCCARDRDVMYVVHSAQCVTRVLQGDTDAIAAVLLILKRLVEDDHAQIRAAETAADEVLRRQLSREIARHAGAVRSEIASQTSHREPSSSAGNGRDDGVTTPARRRASRSQQSQRFEVVKQTTMSPVRLTQCDENWHSSKRNEARSPTPALARSSHPTQCVGVVSSLDESKRRLLEWLRSLGVKIPATSSPVKPITSNQHPFSLRSLLKDGVALGVLAAAIARRRGSVSVRHKLHTVRSTSGTAYERGVLFPQAATLEPRTQAEKRHNLVTAWQLLDECHMLNPSTGTVIKDAEALMQTMCSKGDGEDSGARKEDAIMTLLMRVKDEFSRKAVDNRGATIGNPLHSRAGTLEATGKRAYVTAEQIAAVRKWMKASGVDPNTVSSGILEDSLRNGVALCQLINQVYGRHHARLEFRNPPRTLIEVRENLRKALASIQQDSKLPRVYMTSHAVEGILMGDKQYAYGILWYFMQFSMTKEAEKQHQLSQQGANHTRLLPPPPPPPPSSPQVEAATSAVTSEGPHSRELRPAPRQASAFELDVLASELVEDEASDSIPHLTWTSRLGLPWHDVEMHEDIVPFAILREDSNQEPNWDADILPQKRPQPHVPRDLLPDIPDANETTPQACQIESNASAQGTPCKDARGVAAPLTCMESGSVRPPNQHIVEVAAVSDDQPTAKVDEVIVWLAHLGIHLRKPADLHNPEAKLVEFQSGALLCTIVEKLEHMRPMDGVCRQEHLAKAQALHNLDKALVVLQSKKAIPLHLVRSKWKLYAGDRAAILDLLVHTRRAYANVMRRKPKTDQGC